ncbi:MAG: DAK2 domain-containing protein [Phycicoccus sp.]|nr:DAK2 domain-containing protein [Phycicoccus sp.]
MVHVGGESSRLERLDARSARRWAVATRAAFAAHRVEIDDVNVFPVPDGDTGTNLYMTLDSALEATREAPLGSDAAAVSTLAGDVAALARATLLAARGNSGVILSQLVRGLSEVIAEATTGGDGVDGIDGPTLAVAVRRASDRAYAGVSRPVEGTVLTVAAAAASAAELAAATGADLYAVAHASLAAARVALADTTAQLPSLARAGVVDAGGMGYVLVLEALERVISGELTSDPRGEQTALTTSDAPGSAAQPGPAGHRPGDHGQPDWGGPAYEVMYLLSDSSEAAVSGLREQLDAIGDSVLVVGGEDLWNVHVHVDDVGAAIEAGIDAGRPHRVAVTHFGDLRRMRTTPSAPGSVAVVACAAGEGLATLFHTAGAVVVFHGPGLRASAGQVLDAIRSAGSRCVLVLPNDADTQLAAEVAASAAAEAGIEVHVVRSQSAVQGIAALAVFEPAASARNNLVAMSGAAAATRYGAVTVAAKEAQTSVGWCHPGDVLGVVGGDVVAIGHDLGEVGADVVARLLAGGGELLTVISGAGSAPELSSAVAASAREGGRDVEVSIIDGGQPTYALLLGVE